MGKHLIKTSSTLSSERHVSMFDSLGSTVADRNHVTTVQGDSNRTRLERLLGLNLLLFVCADNESSVSEFTRLRLISSLLEYM